MRQQTTTTTFLHKSSSSGLFTKKICPVPTPSPALLTSKPCLYGNRGTGLSVAQPRSSCYLHGQGVGSPLSPPRCFYQLHFHPCLLPWHPGAATSSQRGRGNAGAAMKSQRRRQRPALPARRHGDADSFPTVWHFNTSSSQPRGVPDPHQPAGSQRMPWAWGFQAGHKPIPSWRPVPYQP